MHNKWKTLIYKVGFQNEVHMLKKYIIKFVKFNFESQMKDWAI